MEKDSINSYEIRNKTIGIIGYGNIGSQLSVLCESIGMKVIYYDKVDKLSIGNASKSSSLNSLLKNLMLYQFILMEEKKILIFLVQKNLAK